MQLQSTHSEEAPPLQQTPTGAKVSFQPLYDVHGGPMASLLTVDGFTFLVDCGWRDTCDTRLLDPLKAAIPRIDAVLLSHPDTEHLGALPYAVGQLQLQAPIYATLPVVKMGQMFMYDLYLAQQASQDFQAFTLDDVDAAFDVHRVHSLKFQQSVRLEGKGSGLSITPFAAGHLLGGAIWRISTAGGDELVYAVDFHHRKERHLYSMGLQNLFTRPAILIVDAASQKQGLGADPEKAMLGSIMHTLRSDGNVLMPVDTAGRVLELILLLEHHWATERLTYPLVLLSPMAHNTLEFAKSQLEWMNDTLIKELELSRDRDNPFSVRFFKLCRNADELAHLPNSPKLVLATMPSLDVGLSRELFADWSQHPRNLVLFTQRAEAGSLAAQVQAHQPRHGPLTLQMQMGQRVPLGGAELAAHEAQQLQDAERTRQLEEKEEAFAAAAAAAAAERTVSVPAEEEKTGASSRFSCRCKARRQAVTGWWRSSSGTMKRRDSMISGNSAELQSLKSSDTQVSLQSVGEETPAIDVLIDKFEVPKGAAAPMFPFEDESDQEEWDEFGAALRPGEFASQQALLPGSAGYETLEPEEDLRETPTKVVTRTLMVPVRAQTSLVDFEGRTDRASISRILGQVAPCQIIILHGHPESIDSLKADCLRELGSLQAQVYTPAEGEALDVSLPLPSFLTYISNDLMSTMNTRELGSYQIAWVDGVAAGLETANQEGIIAEIEAGDQHMADATGGIFIGNVRLSRLKQALADAGIAAQWQAGTLVCGKVIVRASPEDGEVHLEGPLAEDFFRVREVVHAQYHVC